MRDRGVRVEACNASPISLPKVEFVNPDGDAVEYYRRNHLCPAATVSDRVEAALNEKTGTWTLSARDVTSGLTARKGFQPRGQARESR